MGAEHRPFLAHLRKDSDEEVFSHAMAVQQMLDSPGWRAVDELLERVHGEAVSRLLFSHAGSEGGILDQAEYARLLGFLAGLRQTRWAAEAVIEHAERERKKETP